MKKFIITSLIAICLAGVSYAQIPYFAGTAGDANLYGYTSLKVRPGNNNQETYSTLQYGIGDRLAVGWDLYTGLNCSYIGYTVRVNFIKNKWFGLGAQLTPSFDLNNNHEFSYLTGGIYANGQITNDGKLFWVSNTWIGFSEGTDPSFNQWWYLGYYIPIKSDAITPMAGFIHDWRFESDPTFAVGFYYTHKTWNFYLWGDRFNLDDPRLIIGVDYKFSSK